MAAILSWPPWVDTMFANDNAKAMSQAISSYHIDLGLPEYSGFNTRWVKMD